MPRSPEETTAWEAENIRNMDEVAGTELTGANTFRVNRTSGPPFEVGVISVSKVTAKNIDPLVALHPRIAMVVNVPKDSIWSESGISATRDHEISFGGIRDLMSAISRKLEDITEYKRKENEFVERGLSQHDRVARFEQDSDRVYTVHRVGLGSLRVVLLNEYELTADHVRTARGKYGRFDVVLMTNPNGDATSSAIDAARDIRARILSWRQFMGRLNSE